MGFRSFNDTNIIYNVNESIILTINGYYVNNSTEKEKFIKKLCKYIHNKYDGKEIVKNITHIQYCDFNKVESLYITPNKYNSLSNVENCKYIFEPKHIPREIITNHNNVYIFTDHDWKQQWKKNFKRDSKWVYFIKDDTGIKIGMTKNLKRRKSDLQTGNSHKLQIIAYIESETMSDLEKTFHQHLKPLSIIGEWFKLDKEKTVKMLRGCRNNRIIYDF